MSDAKVLEESSHKDNMQRTPKRGVRPFKQSTVKKRKASSKKKLQQIDSTEVVERFFETNFEKLKEKYSSLNTEMLKEEITKEIVEN